MASDLEQVREKLEELDRQLHEVRRRLARLESREGGFVAVAGSAAPAAPQGAAPVPDSALSTGTLALVGRTLVVLGGAYLLRALSEHTLVPPLAGAAAALAYAAFWLGCSARSAARGERTSAVFHGVTATGIGYALVWETTAVFALLAPAVASVVLVGILAAAMGVATRHGMTSLAWTAALAHVATAFAVMFATGGFLPLSLAVLAAAAAVELLPVGDRWPPLRWPLALGADVAVAALVAHHLLAAAPGGEPLAGAAVPAILALPLLYAASLAERALRRGREVSALEVLQLALALALGLAGGARLLVLQGASPAPLGALALALGAGGYAAAFGGIERRGARGPSFHAFSTFAAALVLAGSALMLGVGSPALVGAWGVLAIGAVGLGVHLDHLTLRFHGAAYAVATAGASGLAAATAEALVAAPGAWRALSAPALFAVAVALLATAGLFARRSADAPAHTRVPQAVLAALLAAVLAGLAVRGLAPLSFDRLTETDVPALLAALRSVLLAGLALALAAAGRAFGLRELRWVAVALLALGAAKLLYEDLRVDEPLALFAALGAYGGALIVGSRLLRDSARSRDA